MDDDGTKDPTMPTYSAAELDEMRSRLLQGGKLETSPTVPRFPASIDEEDGDLAASEIDAVNAPPSPPRRPAKISRLLRRPASTPQRASQDDDDQAPEPLFDPGDDAPFDPPPREDSRTRFSAVAKSPYEKLCGQFSEWEQFSLQQTESLKAMRALWTERGLRENDPAFILIEGIALMEKRNRAIAHSSSLMVRHLADMVEELSKTIRDTAPMFAEHNQFLQQWLTSAPQIIAAQNSLASSTKTISESVIVCISLLTDKSILAVTMRIVLILGCILIGFAMGFFFR
jgi:hypothetical protein